VVENLVEEMASCYSTSSNHLIDKVDGKIAGSHGDMNTTAFWDETPYVSIESDVSEEIAISIFRVEDEAAQHFQPNITILSIY
jgi:hypothetical protein